MPDPTAPAGENTSALYGFFCGLIALPTAFVGIGVVFGGAAIALGRLGLVHANGQGRRGLALAGIAFGVISILLVVGLVVDQLGR